MEFNATFLISAISFVVFVIIMNFVFYKPIERIVNERDKFVDNNYNEAKKNNLSSQKFVADYNKRIDEANSEGKSIIDEASNLAKEKKTKLIKEAKIKASEKISGNNNELNREYNDTKIVLENEAKNLANLISEKLFGSTRGNE